MSNYAGFQVTMKDQYLDVLDSTFVDASILDAAVAYMVWSGQTNDPQKSFSIEIQWKRMMRRPALTVDGETMSADGELLGSNDALAALGQSSQPHALPAPGIGTTLPTFGSRMKALFR